MTERTTYRDTLLRIALIGGSVYVVSFLLYGKLIFNSAMSASAYGVNAVTLGISYAMFISRRFRDGFTALFVWYIVDTGLFYQQHSGWWNFLMAAHYVIGLAGAAALYIYLLERRLALHNWIQRWILWTIIVGIAHGCIVVLLQLISMRFPVHPAQTLNWAYMNLRTGTMVGLVSGIGLQLAEYLVHKHQVKTEEDNEDSMNTLNII